MQQQQTIASLLAVFVAFGWSVLYGAAETANCIVQLAVVLIRTSWLGRLLAAGLSRTQQHEPEMTRSDACQHVIGSALYRWFTRCNHSKYGQLLVSRQDVLGPIVVGYLSNLCDSIPPMCRRAYDRVVSAEHDPLSPIQFADQHASALAFRALLDDSAELAEVTHETHRLFINPEPLSNANGCIAEVHVGFLCPRPCQTMQEFRQSFLQRQVIKVAVKVKRYRVERTQNASLTALKWCIALVDSVRLPTFGLCGSRRLFIKLPVLGQMALTRRFSVMRDALKKQLDFALERRSIERFFAQNRGIPGLRLPRVFVNFSCSPDLILTTWMHGKTLSNSTSEECAEFRTWNAYVPFIQVFLRDSYSIGFFHADTHPGNVIIDSESKCVSIVDCGLMGQLPQTVCKAEQTFMNLLRHRRFRDAAIFFLREMVVDEHTMVPRPARDQDNAIVISLESIIEETIGSGDISFSRFITKVCPLLERNGYVTPEEVTVFEVALLASEGCLRKMCPGDNFWDLITQVIDREQVRSTSATTSEILGGRPGLRSYLFALLNPVNP